MKALFSKFDELLRHIDSIKVENDVDDIFFRGHGDSDWNLIPSLGRIKKLKEITENRLYYDFVTYGGHLLPSNKNAWDVLFLMQHHGIPTRLLDWTENFAVALYFAIKHAKPDKAAAIWILDPYELNILSCKKDMIDYLDISFPAGYNKYFIDDDCDDYFGTFPSEVSAICVNLPNTRILAQRGTFTLHKNIETPLEQLYPKCLKKIVISPHLFGDAITFLKLTGITEFTLFPDLDGLSRFVKKLELD